LSLVGVIRGDELADEVDDLRDGLAGQGLDVGSRHAEPVCVVAVGLGELGGDRDGRAAVGIGLDVDLVVHVGDVLDQGDLVAARGEPGAQHGEDDVRPGVADVHEVVDRGTAGVDADLAVVARHELLFTLRE
jgi:hypothetical protein